MLCRLLLLVVNVNATLYLIQAKEYLQKLAMYKEIGFQETAIHESYSKADGNWDKILDILTRSR